MKRIVVVGGGITGLATAHALAGAAPKNVELVLLEASARLGGNLRTDHQEGFVIDGGPDSWVVSKPHASAFARALGLGAELVPTVEANRRVYIAWNGALHPLPEGLVLAVPTRIEPMVRTHLFSLAGKARMALEPFVQARAWEGDEDESISDFITRRLGAECAERLAAPLLGGIFAGDATRISVRAAFPQFVDAERRHGSLIVAMREERAARASASGATDGGKAPSAFVSLRQGMGRLVEAAVQAVEGRVRIQREQPVTAVEKMRTATGDGYRLLLSGGEVLEANAVVVTAPAHQAARLVTPLDAPAGRLLEAIPFVSTATAFYAFRRDDVQHPLDATGFLVPKPLGRRILAVTWVTSKWAGRAPDGHVLMRVFFGGEAGEAILERDDAELLRIGHDELRELMGLTAEPLFGRVYRFHRASPQPLVGHLTRMRALRERLSARLPGLWVAGGGVFGIGVPECVRQGQEVAAQALAHVAGSPAERADPRAAAP